MEVSELKDKLKDVITLLGWYGTETCSKPGCGKPVRYSVLDSSFVTGNVESESLNCPSGHGSVVGGDLSVGHGERYRSMFQDAIALSVNYYYPNLSDAAVVLAHTSLELFLSRVIEYQLKKRRVDEAIARFVLDDMKPNMRAYGELLETLGIKVKIMKGEKLLEVSVKKTKEWEKLWEVSRIRDDVVHRGRYPSDEEVLLVLGKIAAAFTNLSEHYLSPFDEGSKARQQPEEA